MRLTCLEDRIRPTMQTIGRVEMEPRICIGEHTPLLGSGDLWQMYVASEVLMPGLDNPTIHEQLVLLAVHEAFGEAVLVVSPREAMSAITSRVVAALTKDLMGRVLDVRRLRPGLLYAAPDKRFDALLRVSTELLGTILDSGDTPF